VNSQQLGKGQETNSLLGKINNCLLFTLAYKQSNKTFVHVTVKWLSI